MSSSTTGEEMQTLTWLDILLQKHYSSIQTETLEMLVGSATSF